MNAYHFTKSQVGYMQWIKTTHEDVYSELTGCPYVQRDFDLITHPTPLPT